ncbi:hypothetical protein G7046_g7633 [Stylonectria norvegica]|nr:hypothetical protein G7046_g7633 [Stylonectria norvegica]
MLETIMDAALAMIANDTSKVLSVDVGKHTIVPGLYVPKAEGHETPILRFNVPKPEARYIVICVDPDAPFPSWPVLGPVLHWNQSGLKADGDSLLVYTEPFIANYVGPGPPPGSSPHRYVFLLFEQPEKFDHKTHAPANGSEMGIRGRMKYHLDDWAKKVHLGPVIAANYFTSN